MFIDLPYMNSKFFFEKGYKKGHNSENSRTFVLRNWNNRYVEILGFVQF